MSQAYEPYYGRSREDLLAEYIARHIELHGDWPGGDIGRMCSDDLICELAIMDGHRPYPLFADNDGMPQAGEALE